MTKLDITRRLLAFAASSSTVKLVERGIKTHIPAQNGLERVQFGFAGLVLGSMIASKASDFVGETFDETVASVRTYRETMGLIESMDDEASSDDS